MRDKEKREKEKKEDKPMNRGKGAMRNLVATLTTMALFISTVGFVYAQEDQNPSDIEKRIKNAAGVLDEIMSVKDKAIPDKIMSDAKCVAVVPSMVKIALGFGGSHGKGVATCRT